MTLSRIAATVLMGVAFAASGAAGQAASRACPADTLGLGQWQPTTTGSGVLRMPLAGDREQKSFFAERQRFNAGYQSRPHVHSAELHIVVICGGVRVGLTGKPDSARDRRVPPGGFVMIPAGVMHVEWFDRETILHVEAVGPVETIFVDSTAAQRRTTWP
jgi:quercetin dioxygenase-like cupin family protein